MPNPSIFKNKSETPSQQDVANAIGDTYYLWQQIISLVYKMYPEGQPKWNFPGKKYGWSYSIKDKRRAIIYFIPMKNSFEVAFVYGQKATDIIMESDINSNIKNELAQAKKYVEGRGIRIKVNDKSKLTDIEKLITIKLAN